jgi:hypothetical protein
MKNNFKTKTTKEFYHAYDKKIKRRCAHVYHEGYLVSLITGNKIKFKEVEE